MLNGRGYIPPNPLDFCLFCMLPLPSLIFPGRPVYVATSFQQDFCPDESCPAEPASEPFLESRMKESIHPTYYHDASVTCVCGSTFKTGSTQKEVRVDICSQCHPFFTGKQKLMDTEGRIDRFRKKYGTGAAIPGKKAE